MYNVPLKIIEYWYLWFKKELTFYGIYIYRERERVGEKMIQLSNPLLFYYENYYVGQSLGMATWRLAKGCGSNENIVRQWFGRHGFNLQVESYQRLKKMVLDATLLNTQHYKVQIKGKVKQSRKWGSVLSSTSV